MLQRQPKFPKYVPGERAYMEVDNHENSYDFGQYRVRLLLPKVSKSWDILREKDLIIKFKLSN